MYIYWTWNTQKNRGGDGGGLQQQVTSPLASPRSAKAIVMQSRGGGGEDQQHRVLDRAPPQSFKSPAEALEVRAISNEILYRVHLYSILTMLVLYLLTHLL